MKTTIYFSECEQNDDLDNYKTDIVNSGGIVISSKINSEAETARIEVEIDADFADKFRKTGSFRFSNLAD